MKEEGGEGSKVLPPFTLACEKFPSGNALKEKVEELHKKKTRQENMYTK